MGEDSQTEYPTPKKRVSELDFGLAMLLYSSKGIYPLEVVSAIVHEGSFFPCIRDYIEDENFYTGPDQGYSNREQLLRCVGRCWDKAELHVRSAEQENSNP